MFWLILLSTSLPFKSCLSDKYSNIQFGGKWSFFLFPIVVYLCCKYYIYQHLKSSTLKYNFQNITVLFSKVSKICIKIIPNLYIFINYLKIIVDLLKGSITQLLIILFEGKVNHFKFFLKYLFWKMKIRIIKTQGYLL